MEKTRSSSRVLVPVRKAFCRDTKWNIQSIDERFRGEKTLSVSSDGAAHLFEQGEYEEGEEPQAGWGQHAGLLDGQHRLPVGGQRVDGCVGQRVSGVAETGCD